MASGSSTEVANEPISSDPSIDERGRRWSVVVFALAILGSAFLIFLVQPMVAKRILPWFGGTPAVWMLCLAFYQTALFVGYAYAHVLVRFASPWAQVIVHGCVLLAAIAALPILPSASWAVAEVEEPTLRIVGLLVSEIAIPFMSLAATGPLVQYWFARRHPNRSPYPLYALSNIGSMLALFAFPFIVEPRWPLSIAGTGWGFALVAVALAIFVCSWMAARSRGPIGDAQDPRLAIIADEESSREHVGLWLLLSAAAVVLLMGVTNRLCQDVASVPFLWILPLSIYLATFILCFADDRWYRRNAWLGLSLVSLASIVGKKAALLGLDVPFLQKIQYDIALLAVLLFSTCMVLHGELYRLRPAPVRLTAFYLFVSGGGALGGLFVGLLAPHLFRDYYEFQVGLALALLGVLAALLERLRSPNASAPDASSRVWARGIASIAVALVTLDFLIAIYDPWRPIWQERSFFGVLEVVDSGDESRPVRQLWHGTTLHGVQLMAEGRSSIPTTYYGRATALGALMLSRAHGGPMRIGAIGLGAGTVAGYGRPVDFFRFYELDPAVTWVAGADGYFRFLEDSPATVEVELGDARLLLENERATGRRQEFDVLIIDAFSSDSIPTHLMTKEAFEGYRDALVPNGVIAVHVTNWHLHLAPIVSRIAYSIGMKSLLIRTRSVERLQSQAAEWVLVSEDPNRLNDVGDTMRKFHKQLKLGKDTYRIRAPKPDELESTALWTDDYTDLFSVFRPL